MFRRCPLIEVSLQLSYLQRVHPHLQKLKYRRSCSESTWVSIYVLEDSKYSSFCPLLYVHTVHKSVLIVSTSDKKC